MPRLASCKSATLPSLRVVTVAPFLAVTVLLPAGARDAAVLDGPADAVGAFAALGAVVEGLAAVPLPFAIGGAVPVPLVDGPFGAEAPAAFPPGFVADATGFAGAARLADAAAGLAGLVWPDIA